MLQADSVLFASFGLAGLVMGRLWVFCVVAYARASLRMEVRLSRSSEFDRWDRLRAGALDVLLKLSLVIPLLVGLAVVPVGLHGIMGESERATSVRLLLAYSMCLVASMGLSLPRLISWSCGYLRECVRRCLRCGRWNEKTRFAGQQGLGHFARLALLRNGGFVCWRCGQVLDFAGRMHEMIDDRGT